MGELRGREVETFLRAINTGHPGSISTIHADSPERAIDQMALILMLAGSSMSWENIVEYIYRSISVIVQVERRSGKRYISSVVELSDNID
jgi:type IV secretion system protein VirB11